MHCSKRMRHPRISWEVAQTVERASSLRRAGERVSVETIAKYVTADPGYVVEIERAKAKIGATEDITPFALRATNIFRCEEGVLNSSVCSRWRAASKATYASRRRTER